MTNGQTMHTIPCPTILQVPASGAPVSTVLLSLSFFARRNDFVMPPSKVDLVDGGWSWLWLEQPRR